MFPGQEVHLLHALYSAMWSNMWAPSIWTLTGMAWSYIKTSGKARALHARIDELHDKHTDLQDKHDKLIEKHDELIGVLKGKGLDTDIPGQNRPDEDPRSSG